MRARKKRRLYLLLTCGICLCAATGLMLAAFSSTLTYFLSPHEVLAKNPAPGMSFRLGGIVQAGTVAMTVAPGSHAPTTSFRVTDGQASVPVTFTGVLPDLFREGQGVVTVGAFRPDGVFEAKQVLAKHDERYMPKEVAKALKAQGEWRGDGATPAYDKPAGS
jgi:cytochrome c-type biogenesis protein CcmE